VFKVTSTVSTSRGGAHCRITFTIQVLNRHRATETARELGEWLESSLEGILVEEGLWEAGTGSPAPDIPRIIEVLGGLREESPTLGDGDTAIHTITLMEFLSAHFQAKWTEEAGGGFSPFVLHPSSQGSRKGKAGELEEWAQRPHTVDLMGTLLVIWGHPSGGLSSRKVWERRMRV
jgi:hypothetical protein